MPSDLDQFREAFFEEATEHLAGIECALLGLEQSPGDRELLDNIFRCAHSIKGTSGFFGLDEITRFTHSLESLLDRTRAGALEATPERLDLLLRSSDVLRGLIASARHGELPPSEAEGVLAELNDILGRDARPPAKSAEGACPQTSSASDESHVATAPEQDRVGQDVGPQHVPLANGNEVIQLALSLVRAQTRLARTAGEFALRFGQIPFLGIFPPSL